MRRFDGPHKKLIDLGPTLRTFWMLVITVIVVIALNSASNASDRAVTAANDARNAAQNASEAIGFVQAGRQTALAVSCVVLSSVTAAGKASITGAQAAPDTPFTRALEKIGYPPLGKRRAAAALAGHLYISSISNGIRRLLGDRQTKRLINRDGTFDCREFALISHAPVP